MGYLDELLLRNPLVIDGDKIRPHHNYTDDLYTGGKITMTNYDRIKSMSVEKMAKLLYKTYKKAVVNCLDIDENIKNSDKFLEIVMVKEDFLQWLLQEVSNEN